MRTDWKPFANPLGYVRLILLLHWDPIGIFGYDGAMDEYDGYAKGVLNLLESGASDTDIARHLFQIETERMEIRPSSAEKLNAILGRLRRINVLSEATAPLTSDD